MNNREMDATIEEKLFGWEGTSYPDGEWYLPRDFVMKQVPHYSTDIAAAMLVVEKMTDNEWGVSMWFYQSVREWHVEFFTNDRMRDCNDRLLPEAICRAALKAVEEK